MSHFNFKSLAFYGGAIVLVVVLFEIVTNYGETGLKAPVAIDGSYPLSYTQDLPTCLKSNPLVLTIQQSGRYLNASLLPTNTNGKQATAAQKKLSLTGQLTNQEVNIEGTANAKICNNTVPSNQVNIQGKVEFQGREGKNLKGKMMLNSIPGGIEFIAQRQPPATGAEN